MPSFTVRMRFVAQDHDAVSAHLVALTQASRQEPGCITYVPHFVADDPCTVVIYEQYRDEAALDHHRNTVHFKQHAIGGLYQHMRERVLENLVAVA